MCPPFEGLSKEILLDVVVGDIFMFGKGTGGITHVAQVGMIGRR